jgi:hypothetical protein
MPAVSSSVKWHLLIHYPKSPQYLVKTARQDNSFSLCPTPSLFEYIRIQALHWPNETNVMSCTQKSFQLCKFNHWYRIHRPQCGDPVACLRFQSTCVSTRKKIPLLKIPASMPQRERDTHTQSEIQIGRQKQWHGLEFKIKKVQNGVNSFTTSPPAGNASISIRIQTLMMVAGRTISNVQSLMR